MPVVSRQRLADAAVPPLHEPLLPEPNPGSFSTNRSPGRHSRAGHDPRGSPVARGCDTSFLINTEAMAYSCWSGVMIVLAYVTGLQVPVTLAFQVPFHVLTVGMDVLYMLEVFSKFFIPKYHRGRVIVTRSEIAWSYLRGAFWLDMVSAYPMDSFLVWCFGESSGFQVLALLRLLRLRWAAQLIRHMEENIELSYYTTVVFKLLSILFLVAHFEACGFWYLAYLKDFDSTTWVTHFGELREGQAAWDHYLCSLYWTYTTISTTGYGDLVPVNDDERFYTLCMMVLNIGLTAYIVGNTTMLATKADSDVLEYRATVTRVKQYMQHKNIDPELVDATLQHLKLNQDMQAERDDVLQHCAPYMRTRILTSLYKGKIKNCALLHGVSESFINSISQTAQLEFIHCHSPILHAGERSTHLYFVLSGSVTVYNQDGQFLRRNSEGAMFGEETVLCDLPVALSYWSETLVKMLVIPIAAMQDACKRNKMDHRICCFNLESMLRSLSPAEEPDIEKRISKVVAFVTATKTDLVTKLCYASSSGDVAYLKYLLNSDPQHDINMGDYDGRRPIHVASANGRMEILGYLIIEKGADVNVKDIMGGTALQDAVKGGHAGAACFLRQHGAELLLEDTGSVLCNVVFRGQVDLLRMYLEHGADPCLGDYDRRTALHIACAEGLLPIVKVLIEHGADENLRDRWNETPLDEARKNNNKHAVLSYLDVVAKQKRSGQFLSRSSLAS
eukprot:CAMPEP_0117664536 /NCGR_PEP_ID=MMETSP0804-20121206/9281_1 /TAXON_ID=1074897 /ORGANISM="Tetraselmis astigmatica, Strain CCMP880" /LENGTH=729 /DNA_ID=CAMNT_0005471793 /DNA_START=221 /DNA_END=2406 /DNA_ORIENTATION=+